jgi:hypothetical protein
MTYSAILHIGAKDCVYPGGLSLLGNNFLFRAGEH